MFRIQQLTHVLSALPQAKEDKLESTLADELQVLRAGRDAFKYALWHAQYGRLVLPAAAARREGTGAFPS